MVVRLNAVPKKQLKNLTHILLLILNLNQIHHMVVNLNHFHLIMNLPTVMVIGMRKRRNAIVIENI